MNINVQCVHFRNFLEWNNLRQVIIPLKSIYNLFPWTSAFYMFSPNYIIIFWFVSTEQVINIIVRQKIFLSPVNISINVHSYLKTRNMTSMATCIESRFCYFDEITTDLDRKTFDKSPRERHENQLCTWGDLTVTEWLFNYFWCRMLKSEIFTFVFSPFCSRIQLVSIRTGRRQI